MINISLLKTRLFEVISAVVAASVIIFSGSAYAQNPERVTFDSAGEQLVGNLYLPDNYDPDNQYPAVIVLGSWTTVKEQMAGLYADRLRDEGYITLAFDFRNFGESGGEPRFYESPQLKTADVRNAVTYLDGLANVDDIGVMAVCAGAMYGLMAAADDDRIQSMVTVAAWLHDDEATKLFYGGEEGVNARLAAAREAKRTYANTGEVVYIPSVSETDQAAAMYGPFDYYLNPERGAVEEWSDDRFAVMSWEDWLTTNPMPTAAQLTIPTLMIHSDGAVLPDYARQYFNQIASEDKELHWMETELPSPFHQFSYYDQEAEVTESLEKATEWFDRTL